MHELYYFKRQDCSVCHVKAPLVDQLAESYGLPLTVLDTETEEGTRRAEELRIRGVPTLALVIGERVPFRLIGRLITPDIVAEMMERTGVPQQ